VHASRRGVNVPLEAKKMIKPLKRPLAANCPGLQGPTAFARQGPRV